MRPSLRLLALATMLPIAAGAQDQQPPAASREPAVEFSAPRLARIDSMVTRLIAEKRIPGAVVMLSLNGRVAYHKAFGVRNITTRAPLQRDDIFRIASQTKAVTSLAAMMLWEEGKFSLDDPVSKFLPEFDKQTVMTKFNPADSSYTSVPAKRRTTIRQLFTHTSGIDYADIGSDEFKAIYAKAGVTAIGRRAGRQGPHPRTVAARV